jgi:hypothetical protein
VVAGAGAPDFEQDKKNATIPRMEICMVYRIVTGLILRFSSLTVLLSALFSWYNYYTDWSLMTCSKIYGKVSEKLEAEVTCLRAIAAGLVV